MSDKGVEITALKLEIEKLKAKVRSEQAMKSDYKTQLEKMEQDSSFVSRREMRDNKRIDNRMIVSATKTMRVLINLVNDGRASLSNNDIASLCFVSPKSVVNYRCLMASGN